jgi:hypothetical protein
MHYYLMDLERTLFDGIPYFWKGSKHGYTHKVQQAGIFSEAFAEKIVNQDLDQTTIKIHVDVVHRIFGKDFRTYEKRY